MGRTGLEPVTSCVSSRGASVVTHADTTLTTPPTGARTSACTTDAKLAVLGDVAAATTTSTTMTAAVTTITPANPRLGVLADLLADLSPLARKEVIANLPVEDRLAIAHLLAQR